METPGSEPTGPRGPRTTPPHGDPLKKEPDTERGAPKPREEPKEPKPSPEPRPHGDPHRRDLPR